ncbi:MAG: hypothetical protein HFG15_00015 [Bacilli bacterium]|nr:hypothetical protein [Bacilli bacterium]
MNIKISGTESNKNEIIYNNIVDTMKELELTDQEQIAYLKTKVTSLEVEVQQRIVMLCTVVAGMVGIGLGLYFVAIDQYLFGTILSFGTLGLMLYRIYLMFKNHAVVKKDDNYDKIEHLRSMLNMRLK